MDSAGASVRGTSAAPEQTAPFAETQMNAAQRLPKSKSLHAAVRRVTRTRRELADLLFDKALSRTYWPAEPRKSKPRVFGELLWWLVRNGEANRFYYVYGLDLKSRRRTDVMPFNRFQCLRSRANLRMGRPPHNYNYVCVLRDKFLFAQFASSLGVPAPKLFALLDGRHVTWLERNETVPLEDLGECAGSTLDGFCKKFSGMQGSGAFPLLIEEGNLFVEGRQVSVDELGARLTGRFLFQQRIEQHPAMRRLNPCSVNTLRLVSFCNNEKARVLFGALRVGTGHKPVDNWAAGGLVVRIDLDSGELRGDGFFKPGYGGRTGAHPDSGVVFDGFRIPFFSEAIAMVVRLHEYLSHIHSIGWDVAVTDSGPVIVEGNDDWDGVIQMVVDRGFKQQFMAAYGSAMAHAVDA
jgi:hypothetical protein